MVSLTIIRYILNYKKNVRNLRTKLKGTPTANRPRSTYNVSRRVRRAEGGVSTRGLPPAGRGNRRTFTIHDIINK